jgi:hypothetical protein
MFRNEDRRQRFADRRVEMEDRRTQAQTSARARHAAPLWFAPAFGAHLLGQAAPGTVIPRLAQRAYTQPESRTPLRPSIVKSA